MLSATVVNRWFTTQRGLALGLLGAASATGRLLFLPLLATVVTASGWQAVGGASPGVCSSSCCRSSPAHAGHARGGGATPYGTGHVGAATRTTAARHRRPRWCPSALACAARSAPLAHLRDLWHDNHRAHRYASHSPRHRPGVVGGGGGRDLAMMGVLDIAGTLGSGWPVVAMTNVSCWRSTMGCGGWRCCTCPMG